MDNKKSNYKQTEIGEIPEDWELVTLGNISESISETFKFTDEQVVFLNTSDIYEGKVLCSGKSNPKILPGQAKKRIKNNDILFSEIRPANKRYAYIDFDAPQYVVSTKLMVLRALPKVLPKYLYTVLTCPKTLIDFQILAESRSGTFPQITFQEISGYPIALPSLPEQQQIVDFLFSINQKIKINKQMNITLEEIGKALFKRWFMDFEFPNDDGKPYKSSGCEMVDSELGEIPEGWEVKPLDMIATFLNGVACQKHPPVDEPGLPVIKIAELHNGITENSDWASSLIAPEYIVKNGDILFSWSGSLEIVLWTGGRGVLNQHLFKVSSENYPKWFYYFWTLKYLQFFREIASNKATTMGHIQRSHLSESFVLVPQKVTLEKMNLVMTSLLDKVVANSIEIKSLAQIRDSLLQRLMSGKLRVN